MLPDNRTAVQNKIWPVKVGEWTARETPVLCQSGWHGMKEKHVLSHLPSQIGASLWVVETRGAILHGDDKFCAPQMKLAYKIGTTTERNLRLFAADCAEDVLPIFWRVRPDDDRPKHAIEVARRYANGAATEQERAAARDAAGAAAWAAARDAAGDAAGAAAWDAARAAAWAAARDAARDAAGAAAWDAAWDAARDAARELYSNWLVVRIESDR